MAIPVATSELVGTFLEVLGYGAYLVIFPQCLRVIIHKKLATRLKVYFLTSMALIAFFATLHIVVDLTRAFQAFTDNMNTADAPEAYYKNVNTRLNLMKNSAYTSATIVADTLLVYRTFVVWGRNYWIVIVPTLILFVDFAMSVWFTWSVNEARPGSSVLVSTVFARSKYFLIATLVLNVLCTFLISTRIWWIQSRVSGVKSTRSGANAISIIVESAAIYSAVTIVLIILSVLDMSEFFFFLNSMPPLIGIVFAYIILRSSSDKRNYQDTTVAASTGVLSPSSFRRTGDKRSAQSQEFSKPDGVHISLQHIVHRDDIDLEQQSDTDGSPYKHGNGLH